MSMSRPDDEALFEELFDDLDELLEDVEAKSDSGSNAKTIS